MNIHLFVADISIASLPVHYYSEALSTTAFILCWSYMTKHYRQLRVKDLPKVDTLRIEWELNLWPSGRKAPNLLLTRASTPHNICWLRVLCHGWWLFIWFTCM